MGKRVWDEWKETRFKPIADSMKNNIWNMAGFTERKAYVGSLLADLAYVHVTPFEKEHLKRTKLIPSEFFRKFIKTREFIDLERELDKEEWKVKIVNTNKAVAIAIQKQDILFITIRGTTNGWDLLADISIWKTRPFEIFHLPGRFHYGFIKTAHNLFLKLLPEILKMYNGNPPKKIVITGHSLGAAIATHISFWLSSLFRSTSIDAYLYGTPRYATVKPNDYMPFHYSSRIKLSFILNVEDFVPALPPKCTGYTNYPLEYLLQGNGLVPDYPRNRISIHMPFLCLKFHSIDTYIRRLERY